ncbi:MAG TPA: response regulator [Verrucomicrobiae bacterium]|nr:response regulator [Verrucomicrobiae bacterium]
MNPNATLSGSYVESYPPQTVMVDHPRILCVDDNALIRDAISLGLMRKGWDYKSAGSGAEALHWLAESLDPIDIIITDHQMPEMNGLEFVSRLRATGFAGQILVYSTMLTAQECAAYEEMNVGAIVPKDGNFERLARAIVRLQHHH